VLFKPEVGENFGVLVDRIGDVVAADEEHMEAGTQGEQGFQDKEDQRMAALTLGVCKLESQLLVILNPRNFLNFIKTKN
jgi:purine-binding chemotaxis protein CheW